MFRRKLILSTSRFYGLHRFSNFAKMPQKHQQQQQSNLSELLQRRVSGSYEKVPLIVIIGATGCGKTKLSIELAKQYGGEIISADSMQIYKGLNIATNKATAEEQSGVVHHLLDQIDPFKQFTVLDFQKLAIEKIDLILERNKIPIIVGGTNYYIESILWDTLVGSTEQFNEEMNIVNDNSNGGTKGELDNLDYEEGKKIQEVASVDELMKCPITYRTLQSVPSETLHRFLTEIDSHYAATLHHHNKRKIIRCLQVYQQTGKRFSDILAEQQQNNGSRHGGPLRFINSVILWVDCEKNVLDKRLDDRVDQMLKMGLIEELFQFHRDYNKLRLQQNKKADYTEGIFQAIGLKEFHRYLLLDEQSRDSYDGSLVLGNGIILLKQRTRSYVTKQLKWIRRRFLVHESIRKVPNVYRMDTTEPERWTEQVLDKSVNIIDQTVKALIGNDQIREQIWSQVLNPLCEHTYVKDNVENDVKEDDSFISGQFYCDICQVSVSGGKSYQMHLRSKGHKFKLKQQQCDQKVSNNNNQLLN